jgi:glutaconate CoA-transferase subunit A
MSWIRAGDLSSMALHRRRRFFILSPTKSARDRALPRATWLCDSATRARSRRRGPDQAGSDRRPPRKGAHAITFGFFYELSVPRPWTRESERSVCDNARERARGIAAGVHGVAGVSEDIGNELTARAGAGKVRPRPTMTISLREFDFRAARRRLEDKGKAGGDKLTSLEDAASRVKDGDLVALGGCLFSRTPLGLVRALLRRRPRGLVLSRNLMCYEGEWGVVAGAVSKVVTSWMGIGLPWGLSRIVREYVESGRLEYEEWSHLGLGLRFRAAAMGVPFLPSLTMLGSGLMGVGGSRTIVCPYTGETLHAVPALYPDVALLHVHRADRLGNCQIDGYPHMDVDIALASATVLVTAESIVSEEEIRRQPDRTVIPGFVVDALAHVPHGAYPHECYGLYEAEPAHFTEYVAGIQERGAEGVTRYLDRFVYAPATHAEYLALFGEAALAAARERARVLTP